MSDLDFMRGHKEDSEDKTFFDSEINIQANKDFNYLCSKVNCICLNNLNLKTVKKQDSSYVGEFLVAGHDISKKVASLPKNNVDVNDSSLYIAVVCYSGKDVKDVLVFKAVDFAKCKGILKDNKKQNTYDIILKNIDKLKQYSFGYVLNKI